MNNLSKTQIIQLHHLLLDRTGGSPGISNESLLDAAIAAPFATFDGRDLYPTIEAKAARLAFGLVKNHPFVDGNKRIGLLAMMTFLELNLISIECTDAELVELGLSLAKGSLTEEDVLIWIHKHS